MEIKYGRLVGIIKIKWIILKKEGIKWYELNELRLMRT
jgi:hypothetical protein